jgi:hypothetical protein
MKELHSISREEASILANQLFREYNIKDDIDVYKAEIRKKLTRLEASEYIEELTSCGKITPQNGGILFETYEEYIRGWKHVDKSLHSGDSIDEDTGLHYEIKFCEIDNNNSVFKNIKPKDNIDFFVFGFRNTKQKTFTYYRDIPMAEIRKAVRYKEWRQRNRHADESEFDDYEDDIHTINIDIQINKDSRVGTLNRHNFELMKDYIYDV